MKTKIIYEDESILVVHKPAGLATQTAKIGQPDVVSELKNYLAAPYLGVVHRLDQPVEGLLVFAKNKDTAGKLTKQLSEGILNKQYYAMLFGEFEESQEVVELVDYMVKEKAGCAKVVTGQQEHYPEAKKAVLQYRIIRKSEGRALADIHIDTGRFHQIRAQMAYAGYPLLGDVKYGTAESIAAGRALGLRQVALCAYSLDILHPKTHKKIHFEIELSEKESNWLWT